MENSYDTVSYTHLDVYKRQFAVYAARSRLFAYKRGSLLVAMNPGSGEETCQLDGAYIPLFTVGTPAMEGDTLHLPAQSFIVLKPKEKAAPAHA